MIRLLIVSALLAACTAAPAATQTIAPTEAPTGAPTLAPTDQPTDAPTSAPTGAPTAAPTATEVTPTATAAGGGPSIVIPTDNSGSFLTTPDGYSLYTFNNDSPGQSACSGSCAENWPPLQTGGMAVSGGEGVSGTFSTIARDDGITQVTYNDAPLYLFAGDAAPGDTNGDGFNDVWHLAAP